MADNRKKASMSQVLTDIKPYITKKFMAAPCVKEQDIQAICQILLPLSLIHIQMCIRDRYDTARITTEVENIQFELFVTNEKSAISWLYQQLDEQFCGPQTYAELQPKFMQEVKAVDKYEQMPELATILEENFLQDEKGRWYIPDVTKEGDLVKLREKNLWKEFEGYMNSKGKLKLFRSEAIRVGFSRLWKEKNYKAIVDIAERLPEQTIQEDSNLLMYYDCLLYTSRCV